MQEVTSLLFLKREARKEVGNVEVVLVREPENRSRKRNVSRQTAVDASSKKCNYASRIQFKSRKTAT